MQNVSKLWFVLFDYDRYFAFKKTSIWLVLRYYICGKLPVLLDKYRIPFFLYVNFTQIVAEVAVIIRTYLFVQDNFGQFHLTHEKLSHKKVKPKPTAYYVMHSDLVGTQVKCIASKG